MCELAPVRADGETPTEPPVPTEVVTEPPVEQTAEPVEITPTEATPVPVESTPTDVTPEPVAVEETSAVIQLPSSLDDTDVVVLDEEGEAMVLGSQDAAGALVSSDPVWCPANVSAPTPDANGCSESFASIAALLAAMQSSPQSFSQNGTIFLEATNGSSLTTPLILDDSSGSLGSSFNSLSAYNLTIQGGWNSNAGSTSGQTVFDGPNAFVQIGSLSNPWAGSVTINNLAIINVISTSKAPLIVSSDRLVELTNVDVVGSGAGQDGIQIAASDVELFSRNMTIS